MTPSPLITEAKLLLRGLISALLVGALIGLHDAEGDEEQFVGEHGVIVYGLYIG